MLLITNADSSTQRCAPLRNFEPTVTPPVPPLKSLNPSQIPHHLPPLISNPNHTTPLQYQSKHHHQRDKMSIPHFAAQPATSPPPPSTHQGLSNGVDPLTNHVLSPPSTVTITPSYLSSLGTTSRRSQAPAPLTRPSGSTPMMTGHQHPQPRALARTPTAASFATRLAELDGPTATYMRELIESVEAARIGGGALRGEGRVTASESQ